MSGFFGVFCPGGNVNRLVFDQMQKAIQRDGYNELETHVDDHIAMGHLMLRVTPESTYDKQPLNSSCGRYLLVGHFRLVYRDELGDKLGLTQKELDVTPDAVLAMLSYQKWADKCVHQIEGDWSFVVFDLLDNTLTCFKDKFGVSSLYYSKDNNHFIFSSSIQSFQVLKGDAFDIDFHQLYRLSFDGVGFSNSKTMFKGVCCLSPASFLKIDNSLKLNPKEYFTFKRESSIKYRFEEDYVIDFLSFFSSAIKNRVVGINHIGIFQSSGLDSNAILYFASKELEYKKRMVSTYTACNCFLDKIDQKFHSLISDDELFKRSLYLYNNVNPNFLTLCDADFSKEFQQSIFDFDNPIVTKSKFWLRGIIQKAKKENIQLMFTGQLGNFTITWNAPHLLFSELYKFKIRTVLREMRSLKKKYNWNYSSILKTHILKPLIRHLKVRVKNFFGLSKAKLEANSIFKEEFGQTIDWKKEFKSSISIFTIPLCVNSEELRKKLLLINAQVTGIRWYNEAFSNALITSDPTVDTRLVSFLLAIPEFYFNKEGSSKYLFRKMMKGRIYEPLLKNNHTIEQSFDLAYRILHDQFFKNFLNELTQNKELGKIFKIDRLINNYEYLKSQNPETNKYLVAIKLLKDISIVYLYSAYVGRK